MSSAPVNTANYLGNIVRSISQSPKSNRCLSRVWCLPVLVGSWVDSSRNYSTSGAIKQQAPSKYLTVSVKNPMISSGVYEPSSGSLFFDVGYTNVLGGANPISVDVSCNFRGQRMTISRYPCPEEGPVVTYRLASHPRFSLFLLLGMSRQYFDNDTDVSLGGG